jgi:hypothetical protein
MTPGACPARTGPGHPSGLGPDNQRKNLTVRGEVLSVSTGGRLFSSLRLRVMGNPGQLTPDHGHDGAQGVRLVPDQFDVSLEDSDLLGEVELTTNLIIAASETDEHLSDEEIDEILGVDPRAAS